MAIRLAVLSAGSAFLLFFAFTACTAQRLTSELLRYFLRLSP
nr:hypothetical protein [uncultured Campylobacter sp.]